ncbi:MAG: phospholipase [Actinomycetota bacterium]|nr:phospholipase [Actinomycetota bacterium]
MRVPSGRRGALAVALLVLVGCGAGGAGDVGGGDAAGQGRLCARPGPVADPGTLRVGLRPLRVDGRPAGLLYVPRGLRAGRAAPLVVLLHGAGGDARGGLAPLIGLADAAGTVLVAADSRGRTWDLLLGGFGPDVARIDELLGQVLRRVVIDRSRLAIGGFSDGATYALSLGLTNGELFSHLIAFSPGGATPEDRRGKPRVFISHGVRDAVLPIDPVRGELVPSLRREGHDVTFREFAGGHGVPPAVAREAVAWLLGGRRTSGAPSR